MKLLSFTNKSNFVGLISNRLSMILHLECVQKTNNAFELQKYDWIWTKLEIFSHFQVFIQSRSKRHKPLDLKKYDQIFRIFQKLERWKLK